jgi:hypothetical protein
MQHCPQDLGWRTYLAHFVQQLERNLEFQTHETNWLSLVLPETSGTRKWGRLVRTASPLLTGFSKGFRLNSAGYVVEQGISHYCPIKVLAEQGATWAKW